MHQPLSDTPNLVEAVTRLRAFLARHTDADSAPSQPKGCSRLPPGLAVVRDAEGQRALEFVRTVHLLQDQVGLTAHDKLLGEPKSGFYHVDSQETLRRKLARPNTELFLLEVDGKVIGYELYWKVKGSDLEKMKGNPLAKELKRQLEIAFDGNDKAYANLQFAIDAEAVIIPSVRKLEPLKALRNDRVRRALYEKLHEYVVQDMKKEGMHFGFATCRISPCENPALKAHALCAWRPLSAEAALIQQPADIPGVYSSRDAGVLDKLRSVVLWLDVQNCTVSSPGVVIAGTTPGENNRMAL